MSGGQQQMLAGTARAVANSLAQYGEEFPVRDPAFPVSDQLYLDALAFAPEIDGYFDDWSTDALHTLRGADGPVRFALGVFEQAIYLYVEVVDRNVVYATPQSIIPDGSSRHADRVVLASSSPPYLQEAISFAAEAPGRLLSYRQTAYGFAPEPTIRSPSSSW